MSEEEMDRIEYMREDDFERKEWLALNFSREWVFSKGKPCGPDIDEYMSVYTKREKAYHLKLIHMMNFANRFRITFGGRPFRNEGAACSIEGIRE